MEIGSAAPKAAAAEGPASGGPEAGPASGVPDWAETGWPDDGLLAYALKFLTSDVIYFQEVSEADMEQHKRLHGCEPLVTAPVVLQRGSHQWTALVRGWRPKPGSVHVKMASLRLYM